MTRYESFNTMKPRISVCTSANVINVQGFIDELSVKFPDFDVLYFELPYNDIDNFTFRGSDVDIMILCHSINNRRFAITEVMNALYDQFLPNSVKILGKERMCVVAHDFPATKGLVDPDKYEAEMEIFKNKQPTTFTTSSLVMMGGKLEGPFELQESNGEQLREFLMNAARSPMPEPKGWFDLSMERLHRNPWRVVTALTVIGVVALIIGLIVGIGDSSTPPVSPTRSTSTRPIPSTATATTNFLPTALPPVGNMIDVGSYAGL